MISERMIQILLENQPDLLSAGLDNVLSNLSWMLVDREVGIPDEEGGTDRWFLDHLFIDHLGIPTLVEVKLFGPDDIRRTIIGQMFDYATFASKYWPPELIRDKFEETCRGKGDDPIDIVSSLLGKIPDTATSYDEFWREVQDNLRDCNIRLIFFADKLSDELKEVIVFVQHQMANIDVRGVEIGQYLLENHLLLDGISVDEAGEISVLGDSPGPDYDGLYELAEKQAGCFAAYQAREMDFTWERLSNNVKNGVFIRIARGIYRFTRFPRSPYQELFEAWLRTDQKGTISHESALSLLELTDDMSEEVHLIVPRTSSRRRKGVRQHTNKITEDEITHVKGLPATKVDRTIADVAKSGLQEVRIKQAVRRSIRLGLTSREELASYAHQRGGRARKIILETIEEEKDHEN